MSFIKKNILELIFGVIIVTVIILLSVFKNNISPTTTTTVSSYATTESSAYNSAYVDKKILVYVTGDVYNPGEFSVSSASTFKVLWKICRPMSDIDPKDYNMSEKLIEGRHYIIKKQEINKPGVLINVNTSTSKELSLLPGIGEVTAAKIIDYRINNGLFTNLEIFYSLLEGVSSENLSKIKEQVTLF